MDGGVIEISPSVSIVSLEKSAAACGGESCVVVAHFLLMENVEMGNDFVSLVCWVCSCSLDLVRHSGLNFRLSD